jgi:hypothetical protein
MIDDDTGVVDLGDGTLKTGIPPKSAPEAWLNNVFIGQQRFDQIIQTLQGHTDPRIYYFARNLIIKIPEDTIRKDLLVKLDEEVARINGLKISSEEKGSLVILTAQNAVGQVTSYADEFVGIARTLVIRKI